MDVVSILNELNLPFKENFHSYTITCPNQSAHSGGEDKNPSCNISKNKEVFHCFSCGYSGHISKLYSDITGKKLDYMPPYFKEDTVINNRGDIQLLKGKELSVNSNPVVMSFLKNIGIYKQQFIDQFQLFYVKYAEYGQKVDKKPIKFINRIMFPVFKNGELINIEGRDFTGNSDRKTMYPRNSISDYVFNIEKIDSSKPVIVVEGIKDLCKVWNVDHNVVSIFGGNFTEIKRDILINKGVKDLIVFIDNDTAGYKMANKIDELWPYEFNICIPDKENNDPNDLTLKEIRDNLDKSEDYTEWVYNFILGKEVVSW